MTNHVTNRQLTPRRIIHLPAVKLLFCLAVIATLGWLAADARAANDDLLSSERWESRGEGLSIRLPLGAQTLQLTGDDAILRIGHPDGYKITIYIKQSKRDLTLAEVMKAAEDQTFQTITTLRKVGDPIDMKLDSLPAKGFGFAAPQAKPPTVLVQVFAMLSKRKVLLIELNAPPAVYKQSRPVYDQVLASFKYEDPEALLEKRKAQLEAGQKWLETITPEKLHKAMIAEQWFRMVDGKTDIGYMRIDQRKDRALNRPGVRIDVQSRVVIGKNAYDTLSNYFASDDAGPDTRSEIWSVRTTIRPREGVQPNNQPGGKNVQPTDASWAETGLLSKGTLSLTRQSPEEKKPYEWSSLPPGYITQVYSQMLPSLLGPADKEPLAFYAYYGNTGKIALRTERVEAAADGSYKVYSRSSPEQKEQVSWYDAKGNLLQRVLPGGQVLLPATAQQIVSRWQLK